MSAQEAKLYATLWRYLKPHKSQPGQRSQPNVEVLDDSKLGEQASSDTKIPTKTESIGNAFDSKGFKLANGETVGPLDAREARFS